MSVDPSELHPEMAPGLTQGPTAATDAAELSSPHKSGQALVQHQLGGEQKKLGRLPVFRAILSDDLDSVWQDEGRLQRNVVAKVDKETMGAIQAGHMCLRCYEPQPESFPEACDLCGYPMRERQIMDAAMEFRADSHVGPGMPVSEWLAEQEARLEKKKFEKRIAEGGSRGRRG